MPRRLGDGAARRARNRLLALDRGGSRARIEALGRKAARDGASRWPSLRGRSAQAANSGSSRRGRLDRALSRRFGGLEGSTRRGEAARARGCPFHRSFRGSSRARRPFRGSLSPPRPRGRRNTSREALFSARTAPTRLETSAEAALASFTSLERAARLPSGNFEATASAQPAELPPPSPLSSPPSSSSGPVTSASSPSFSSTSVSARPVRWTSARSSKMNGIR